MITQILLSKAIVANANEREKIVNQRLNALMFVGDRPFLFDDSIQIVLRDEKETYTLVNDIPALYFAEMSDLNNGFSQPLQGLLEEIDVDVPDGGAGDALELYAFSIPIGYLDLTDSASLEVQFTAGATAINLNVYHQLIATETDYFKQYILNLDKTAVFPKTETLYLVSGSQSVCNPAHVVNVTIKNDDGSTTNDMKGLYGSNMIYNQIESVGTGLHLLECYEMDMDIPEDISCTLTGANAGAYNFLQIVSHRPEHRVAKSTEKNLSRAIMKVQTFETKHPSDAKGMRYAGLIGKSSAYRGVQRTHELRKRYQKK